MSGKRLLNSSAIPLPITPTQFTVLTRVWAWDSNMSPISTRITATPPSTEEQTGVHQHRQIWRGAPQRRLTLRTGHIGSNHVESVHVVGHKNLGTLDRF